jgi:hypothetical protein
MTIGYFPENYVLPPCFSVEKYPTFGKQYYRVIRKKFKPNPAKLAEIQFPKSNFADRIFSIINPEIYCQMAYEIASYWKILLLDLFNSKNKVVSYSFPIPLDSKNQGKIGKLRSGRMIYEYIEMVENDIAAEAYRFEYLAVIDLKNFYPSIYTHSLAWAFHDKQMIRSGLNRHDPQYIGNRIDTLFQCANDEMTHGIPIGPAISDIVSEVLLARIDTDLSKILKNKKNSKNKDINFLAVRFKDDYRILCMNEEDALVIIKELQHILREYELDLNENKTTIHKLPNGIFRPWVSRYHAVNPQPKKFYEYKRFKEVYLAVVAIDRDLPNTGVVDRFLADIITKDNQPNFRVNRKTIPKIISLLLMLAELRIKSFPKILGIIEAVIRSQNNTWYTEKIGKHLGGFLHSLASSEIENRYLIIWILYFLKSNQMDTYIDPSDQFTDAIVRTVFTDKNNLFISCPDFNLYSGIKKAAQQKSLLEHLAIFSPQ